MSLNLEQLQQRLCESLCAEVQLIQRQGRLMVTTPFVFPDGDSYVLYLEERPGGLLRLTDAGHTLMHFSYETDVDQLRQGTRGRLLDQVLAHGGLQEQDGELYLDTSPGELGTTLFRVAQALTRLNDLTFLNRPRVDSSFYDDLSRILSAIVGPDRIQKDYIYPGMENASDYPIDFCIEGKIDPLFIFGIPNRDKARLATIVLERLLRAQSVFDSVLIFADQSTIPSTDLARLSNAGGEMIASLDAQEDLQRKIERRVA